MTQEKNISGVYQLHQPDFEWYKQIDSVKQGLTERFSNEDINIIHGQLNDLFSDMQSFLMKAFKENEEFIKKTKVRINGNDFDFFQLKDLTVNVYDRITLRKLFESVSQIWGHFAKVLKISLPTQSINIKKNSLEGYSNHI